MTPTHIAGLVVAAGASRRLGHPKQLVEYQGKPLIIHAIEKLEDAGCDSVTVVLGANRELIAPLLNNVEVNVITNEGWESGIGSSIACGTNHIASVATAVLISLCDQPLISVEHFTNLINDHSENTTTIFATKYPDGTAGVPALFPACHFPDLKSLSGNRGAKRIIEQNHHSALDVIGDCLDVDTKDAQAMLLRPRD